MADETFDLRAWIRGQRHVGYTADLTDDDHFRLESDYAIGQVNFYAMEPKPEVVELTIEDRESGEVKFFLHFHVHDKEHAIGLFREMVQALRSIATTRTTKVLLCCTAGMTTSFFAERLNQVAEAMGLDWHFSAVAAQEVFEHGRDKAAVLVAPQIAYQAARMQDALPEVPVLEIPVATFASYDAAGCIEWAREEVKRRRMSAEDRALEHAAKGMVCDRRVFVVAAHAQAGKVTINYRLYDHGSVTLDERVIKRTLSLADFSDVLDTKVCRCTGTLAADVVGIALPGIVGNGTFSLGISRRPRPGRQDIQGDLATADHADIEAYFRDRYDVPIFLCNNANAAALGWYGSQDEFENVAFHSQAAGWAIGGQCHIVGGRLVEGAHGIAGEVRFVVNRLSFSHPVNFNPYAPADVLEMVGQVLALDCVTFDPEVIALRCDLLPDMDEVRDEIAKYIPREYLPEIRRVENYNECILLGTMILCLRRLRDAQ